MKIGSYAELLVSQKVAGGYVLADGDEVAFLAKHYAPEDIEIGQTIRVFLYATKSGDVMATATQTPTIQVGQFGVMKVIELAGPGAYLDWGIDRDLLVPFNLQHRSLKVDDVVVVACDIDDYNRVFGSTKLAEFFDRDLSPLALKQEVQGLVYGFNPFGVLLVIEGRYAALAFHDQVFTELTIGDEVTCWITNVRDDGRVDVSLQQGARKGTLNARDQIVAYLQENNGFVGLHDKSSPAEIRQVFEMSKKVFKKAVGSLYKDRMITLRPNGIRLATLDDAS